MTAAVPSHYVLGVEDPEEGYRARLVYERDHPLRSWMSGARFEHPPPEPIELTLQGTDEAGWVLGDLWLTPITVMSKRLLDALRAASVDNLDTYAVRLRDPVSGEVYDDFVAFNLVGVVSAADREGIKMFRLAESRNAILIHGAVCDAIEDAGIDTLTFYEPEDWAG
jgi:hypothetical protein